MEDALSHCLGDAAALSVTDSCLYAGLLRSRSSSWVELQHTSGDGLTDYYLSNITIILLLVDASTAIVLVTATDGALPPSLKELTR